MESKKYKFWFITGTQLLYGTKVIEEVDRNSRKIVCSLNDAPELPGIVLYKGSVVDPQSIRTLINAANSDPECAGVITWMHTFSPSKMWISGLLTLQKPYLHLDTQFYRDIPWDSIDMDYMNLHQSAHGDREHGYIGTRMRIARKVIAGHWQDPNVLEKIGRWMRSAIGAFESRRLKICRFGDNMRSVAVTEGDKVDAEIKFGWSVDGYGIGDILHYLEAVTDSEISEQMNQYYKRYEMCTDNIDAVRYQAKVQVAINSFLDERGYTAFTDTFEDLHGLQQLPGLAVQDLCAAGYGFGAEGDWKTAAMCRIMKLMSQGLTGGTSFMEDYSYHFDPKNPGVLGAHMLEVDPSLASGKPRIEVHPLGIGGREDPARLCFESKNGLAILVSLIDLGNRFRMVINDVEACEPFEKMPKLPTARIMWKPFPNIQTSAEAWILTGGAHHTVLSYDLDAEIMQDFCKIMGIECVHISNETTIPQLEKELMWNEVCWKFLT